ncbi:uncharacterized protein VTP21DRAFT_4868 [Calcarisporiella thermophila]|uniref:uncharacterized protein n=1 Tax=Calcarisporiella thermophila TaxID=911321 RepID=UPI0037423538
MYKRLFLLFLSLLLIASYILWNSPLQWPPPKPELGFQQNITTLVVFGDSYSDNGHTRARKYSFARKYSTNGKTWNQYLSDRLSFTLYNFAWSGATADNSIVKRYTPSVKEQVKLFYRGAVDGVHGSSLKWSPERTLFSIWIGVNDVTDIFFQGDNATRYDLDIASVRKSMEDLVSHGARHFMLINVPPIQHMPIVWQRSRSNSTTVSRFSTLVQSYNTKLEQLARTFRAFHADVGVDVLFIDAHGIYSELIQSNLFANTEDPCSPESSLWRHCRHPDNYLFWDTWHPTTRVHRMMAEVVYEVLVKHWTLPSPAV